jgi:protein tyrosine phosphatase (PTP) superfamily phosphohydrolase (DUF442 family)
MAELIGSGNRNIPMEQDLTAITNFLRVSDNLGTAGQPTRAQFSLIKEAGYEVVINLALGDSPNALYDEEGFVKSLGMMYYPIPVIWEKPEPWDLQRFFALMDQEQGRKIFAHCVMNMRVTAFVYLYQILRLGEPPESALEMMHQVWEPDEIWQAFIDKMLSEGITGLS